MKKKLLLFVIVFVQFIANGQNKPDSIYLIPTVEASFAGGDSARVLFVKNNLKTNDFPAESSKNTIYVQFVVEKSGVLSDVKIIKGINQTIDEEVLRMTKTMPNWIPAQLDGQVVRSQVVFPVSINSNVSEVVIDTAFLSKNWKRTVVDSATYYRIRKMNGPKFKIQYHLINGTLIEQGEYSSISPEKKDGSFIAYYDNGVKSSEYVMVNDTIQGEATDYYPNGVVRLKQNYYNNLKHGNFYEYLDNGQLNYIRTYKNGIQTMVSDGKEKDKIGADSNEAYIVVEEDPEFPGGDEARMKFLARNLKYPVKAREEGIQGTVYLVFIIEIDGSMSNLLIKKNVEGGCGEEALRVIKMMPKWIPGKQRGKPVRTQFTLPVKFVLN